MIASASISRLIGPCFIAGITAFVGVLVWAAIDLPSVAAGYYAGGRALGMVHLAVLGWINLMIFGTLFQFVPVALGRPIASERLAWWQLACYVPGVVVMVASFATGRFDWPLRVGAVLVWIGCGLFIWNMLWTLRGVPLKGLTVVCIWAATWHLLATIVLGLLVSFHLTAPLLPVSHLTLLKVHAAAGLVGWYLLLVLGVAAKLLPMFALAHGHSERPGWIAFGALNGAVLAFALSATPLGSPLAYLGAALLAGGLAATIWQVTAILRARMTGAQPLDFALRFVPMSFGLLALAVAAAVALSATGGTGMMSNRLAMLLGYLAIGGFFSLLIQSFLYRIVPFIAWIRRFAASAGRRPTPKVRELAPQRSGFAQLSLYLLGTLTAAAGIAGGLSQAIRFGSIGMAIAGVWLVINLMVVFRRAAVADRVGSARARETVAATTG
jgi:hypothetical protein